MFWYIIQCGTIDKELSINRYRIICHGIRNRGPVVTAGNRLQYLVPGKRGLYQVLDYPDRHNCHIIYYWYQYINTTSHVPTAALLTCYISRLEKASINFYCTSVRVPLYLVYMRHILNGSYSTGGMPNRGYQTTRRVCMSGK